MKATYAGIRLQRKVVQVDIRAAWLPVLKLS